MTRFSLHSDVVSGFLLLLSSAWIWWYASTFPKLDDGYPGPALFPQVIAIALACAGLFIAARQFRRKQQSTSLQQEKSLRVSAGIRLIAGIALAVSYPLLIQYIHFIAVMSTLIFLVGLLLRISAWRALLAAVSSSALIYGIFTYMLNVQL